MALRRIDTGSVPHSLGPDYFGSLSPETVVYRKGILGVFEEAGRLIAEGKGKDSMVFSVPGLPEVRGVSFDRSSGGKVFVMFNEPDARPVPFEMLTTGDMRLMKDGLDRYVFTQRNRHVTDLLFDHLTVGGDVSRATFYYYTKDMSEGERGLLRSLVSEKVERYYSVLAGYQDRQNVGRDPSDFLDLKVRNREFIHRSLEALFRPWTFLAGRIEDAIEFHKWDVGYSNPLDVKALSVLLGAFVELPEYAPFVDKELKGFAYNVCIDNELDYTGLAASLRTPELDEAFRRSYLWLVEDASGKVLEEGFKAGRKAVPEVSNRREIIGEETFTRYFPFSERTSQGVFVDGRKGVGVAFTGRKDSLRSFVVYGDEACLKCKPLDGDVLSSYQKKRVLESIHRSVLHRRNLKAAKEARRGSNGIGRKDM